MLLAVKLQGFTVGNALTVSERNECLRAVPTMILHRFFSKTVLIAKVGNHHGVSGC
jgi:hypothetical protein